MKSKPLYLSVLFGILSITLVAQDMKFQALEWRFIGPMTGTRGSVVLGHPTRTSEFYFGASNGLWKTEDAGASFQNSPGGSLIGAAFGWGQPNETTFSEGLNDQYTLEIFYRLQLSTRIEITPDLQYLINPALNPDASSIFMWGIRGRQVL